jgi:hypothetical protein
MGTDIHWVIERRHRDGAWEAVSSKLYCYHIDISGHHPLARIGKRNCATFGVLSDVRRPVPDKFPCLARKEFPKDVSPYTINYFVGEGKLQDHDWVLHHHGWVSLGDLRLAVENDAAGFALDEEEVAGFIEFTAHIESAILEPGEASLDTLLVGRARGQHPDMFNVSAHETLARVARAEELLPIDDDTLRIIIWYDS